MFRFLILSELLIPIISCLSQLFLESKHSFIFRRGIDVLYVGISFPWRRKVKPCIIGYVYLLSVLRWWETFSQADSNPEWPFAIPSQIPVRSRWKYTANIYQTLLCFPLYSRGEVCLFGSSSLHSQENKSGTRFAVVPHPGCGLRFPLLLIMNIIVLFAWTGSVLLVLEGNVLMPVSVCVEVVTLIHIAVLLLF